MMPVFVYDDALNLLVKKNINELCEPGQLFYCVRDYYPGYTVEDVHVTSFVVCIYLKKKPTDLDE